MVKDLIKDDERVLRHLGAVSDHGRLVLLEDLENGNLPPMSSGLWYWNTYQDAPCYLDGENVYCFSYETIGEFYLLGTLDDLEEEYQEREAKRLRFWGMERLHYLNRDYGSVFGLLCRGDLWESCKKTELEAEEREDRMMFERMRPYENLKNTDPLEYSRIWNNEKESVREIIRKELIYV